MIIVSIKYQFFTEIYCLSSVSRNLWSKMIWVVGGVRVWGRLRLEFKLKCLLKGGWALISLALFHSLSSQYIFNTLIIVSSVAIIIIITEKCQNVMCEMSQKKKLIDSKGGRITWLFLNICLKSLLIDILFINLKLNSMSYCNLMILPFILSLLFMKEKFKLVNFIPLHNICQIK